MHAHRHRQHEDEPERRDQRAQREQRHALHPHTWCPRGQYRRGDARRHRGQPDQRQRISGQVQADHVGLSARRAAVVDEPHDDQHDAAEPRPETGRGEPRERQRARSELQWDGHHTDAEEQREHRSFDETDPVAGEELRQRVVGQHGAVAVDPFEAEHRAEGADDQQSEERGADEEPTDHLVIAGGEDADDGRRSRRRVAHGAGGRVDGGVESGVEGAHICVRLARSARPCAGATASSGRTLLVMSHDGRNPTDDTRPSHQYVQHHRAEQQRDVRDAVREHLHRRGGTRAGGERDRAAEEPGAEHDAAPV